MKIVLTTEELVNRLKTTHPGLFDGYTITNVHHKSYDDEWTLELSPVAVEAPEEPFA